MNFFGTYSGMGPHSNFENFGNAVITLVRIITQDGWEEVMFVCRSYSDISVAYFLSFVVVGSMIMTNLFMAVVVVRVCLPFRRYAAV